ncbi:MAG TPA: outer membrane beta-barrel protein [Vicinamibacterales bacterium]|nr:outer membrane beta-barrel protein [Vicinamibacterales bacterium]
MNRLRAIAAAALLFPASAAAQSVEISGGVAWTGGYEAGSRNATETANSSTGGSPITLFTSSSRVKSVAGVDARVGVNFGSRVGVEGLFQFFQPELRVTLGSDFENALPEQAVGSASTYLFGGSLVYHFGSGRIVPFLLGGGAYLRQLDEDNAQVTTGNEVHGGGGVKIWLGSGAPRFGVRVDAQASVRSTSPGFESTRRVLPAVNAGLIYRF